jgi:hypothetical protein
MPLVRTRSTQRVANEAINRRRGVYQWIMCRWVFIGRSPDSEASADDAPLQEAQVSPAP